jgi:hypothetical protein
MFPVPSELRDEVWEWAQQANIHIEYNGTDFDLDVWRVVDTEYIDLFVLRWG